METAKPRRSRVAMIYEGSIQRLSNKEKLELIGLITADMAEEIPETRKLRNIMEFAGVGAHNPIGIDATEYIKSMRDEWDKEP